MFNFHTHNFTKNGIQNVDDINKLPQLSSNHLSIGNHPWYKAQPIEKLENDIKNHPKVIAIGECGLDKVRSFYPIDKQIEILEQQIILAEKLELPLILHIVKSYNEIIQLKNLYQPKQKWIIHGFNNYKQAPILLENGIYLSFGPSLLNNNKLQSIFREINISKIFLENDDTDLPIEILYTFAADLKSINIDILIRELNKNLNRITNGKLA